MVLGVAIRFLILLSGGLDVGVGDSSCLGCECVCVYTVSMLPSIFGNSFGIFSLEVVVQCPRTRTTTSKLGFLHFVLALTLA